MTEKKNGHDLENFFKKSVPTIFSENKPCFNWRKKQDKIKEKLYFMNRSHSLGNMKTEKLQKKKRKEKSFWEYFSSYIKNWINIVFSSGNSHKL